MKFSTFTVLLCSVAASFAQQVIVSPTPGQVISTNTAFNLTYVTQRSGGFEESSISIDVVISDINLSFPFPGGLPISGLTPTGTTADGSSVYSTFVNPIVIDGNAVGNRTISVVEYFNAAGGNPGLDVVFVPVTFADIPPA
ncbi:hypothetical protein DFH07DRAFT_797920 [Mycena maculata]|uniref:Uncharacterized protein n=1 Tax=Mycena maculata TaxID=230809 RepID=A0AAD7NVL1_9AGAR|nr:hypothetical protein DFH07DRAFT_797920 [Mycena maculata]